ncbi:MAG: electron transfer flavoprotein subunit beta/FixA family protein [Bryobacteraceae bacterium]|nr:electron transfer flavoprotein subunit beta/FixA family protein [Bryobacteraceae bacterium]
MKILVALKQVPARDSILEIDSSGRTFNHTGLQSEINEPDAYALEAALQLKDQQGGEVVVLCAGPEEAASSIREALAKGADRALHVLDDTLEEWDPLSLARLLAKAAETESPDLILTGLQSDDTGSGQTGVLIASLLGMAHATIVMKIEVNGRTLKVKRELEGGWFQYVSMPLPAVLTVQSGINKLRYATLMGIKKAKSKEVKTLTSKSLGVPAGHKVVLERLSLPRKSKETVMLAGSPAEQAAQLVEKLKFEVKAL